MERGEKQDAITAPLVKGLAASFFTTNPQARNTVLMLGLWSIQPKKNIGLVAFLADQFF